MKELLLSTRDRSSQRLNGDVDGAWTADSGTLELSFVLGAGTVLCLLATLLVRCHGNFTP